MHPQGESMSINHVDWAGFSATEPLLGADYVRPLTSVEECFRCRSDLTGQALSKEEFDVVRTGATRSCRTIGDYMAVMAAHGVFPLLVQSRLPSHTGEPA